MSSAPREPQDLVAIFHASFHPTKGHTIDWCAKASDELNIEDIEFSALPSGLHLVEQDVIYFTKDAHHGVCIFRRRVTTEHGHRGFRLSSFGVLLARSLRPRPWRHVVALKQLLNSIYTSLEDKDVLEPQESDWNVARVFFEQRKLQRADLGGAGSWHGWSDELDGPDADLESNPALHLPHLLRILGPSSLTLYKHVLGRRRVLIYTLPPVEAACILCHVAADMCFDVQNEGSQLLGEDLAIVDRRRRPKGKYSESIRVLGMVTLNDVDKMDSEGKSGRGWIACTTDAIFLEKPAYYDLIIDLTTSTPVKAARPALLISRSLQQPTGSRGPKYRLTSIRFTWSDIKLWKEIDWLLERDSASCRSYHGASTSDDTKIRPVSPWTDAWCVYEDVCIICGGLWMGMWRGNFSTSNSERSGIWGDVMLPGEDDLIVDGAYVRNVGMGIEGRPADFGFGTGTPPARLSKAMKRTSAMSLQSRETAAGINCHQASSSHMDTDCSTPDETVARERRDRHVLVTLAILQTFHAHARFQLSQLATLLEQPSESGGGSSNYPNTIEVTPKDIMTFELGPFSSLDARFVEWLGEEYGDGKRLVVKRGWKDLLGVALGLG